MTHDQVEAMTMADRVAVMAGGVLQQCDSPRTLYAMPANAFVAGFIGSPPMNLVSCSVTDGSVHLGGSRLDLPRTVTSALTGSAQVLLGFRPESLLPAPHGDLEMVVDLVEELGSDAYAHGHLRPAAGATELIEPTPKVVARVDAADPPVRGDVLRVAPRPGARFAFRPGDGALLGVF